MEEKRMRIDKLVEQLNLASGSYYNSGQEAMSNYEWDMLLDELMELEQETDYVRPDSPTQNVGYESGGEKEIHEFPALSLAKTKLISQLQEWAGERPVWLSWKLDGLTLVLTYDEGKLVKILTRGNGEVGKNITFLKSAISGIPPRIKYKGHMVVRGEAAISYTDFAVINDTIEDDNEKYANPRNLASGTLNLDDPAQVKERCVQFHAFTLVYMEQELVSWGERMEYLKTLGFTVVDYEKTDRKHLPEVVERWTGQVENRQMDIPVDGLVLCYDDTDYASSGSVTGHHATRAGLAFKWEDASADTKLSYIEWSCAVSTISPVAVFEPVQLEGTTVSRASLCNLSEIERLGLGRECTLTVIKANKIIPKCIAVSDAVGEVEIPGECPVCHAKTRINVSPGGTKTLHCTNPDCTAKNVKKFARFVGKNAMEIDGLSTQTMLKFINDGYIREFADIYHLREHFETIAQQEGFGEKSVANMDSSIEKSRHVHPVNFIFALCIPLIGIDAAKKIVTYIGFDAFLQRMEEGMGFEDVEGIGGERSNSILNWYKNEKNREGLKRLLQEVNVEHVPVAERTGGSCMGLVFVITGDVHIYKNRDEFKAFVEEQGGKVTAGVSKKTSFLVNNDAASESSKNRKARELQIPILTEEEFIARFGEK
ncbi:MAG: NAD-dependent DNA ligase LigA [Blautia sp.]|nr:NAD-dependent DNA ligase LigA [Blautia sp.]